MCFLPNTFAIDRFVATHGAFFAMDHDKIVTDKTFTMIFNSSPAFC